MIKLQRQIQDLWNGGSNPSRGGFFSTFYLVFHKFLHEIEIIWAQSVGGGGGGGVK